MANYQEKKDSRKSIFDFNKDVDIIRLQDGRLSATCEGQWLGIDKRLQAKAMQISTMTGAAKAEAETSFWNDVDIVELRQVDEHGNPVKFIDKNGVQQESQFGYCLVMHTSANTVMSFKARH